MVISASAGISNVARHAAIRRAISSGSSSDGVPPPKKIVSAGSPDAATDLPLQRVDVPALQAGIEQAAIEIAVTADGRAERM
jgi:hypothetical protein